MSESDHHAPRRPAFFEAALEAHGPAYDPTEQIHVAPRDGPRARPRRASGIPTRP